MTAGIDCDRVGVTPENRELVFAAIAGIRKDPREVVAHHKLSIDIGATAAQPNDTQDP